MNYDALVQGVDISHWQNSVNWPQLVLDRVAFDYIKVEQNTGEDPLWPINLARSQAAGIFTMAYVFLTADDTQASVDKALALVPVGMPIVLDWEAQGVPDSVVELWINGLTGQRPVLAYYGIDPPDSITSLIATVPRILPEYSDAPRLPAWDGVSTPDWTQQWLIWQRSEQGAFQGETGNFDLDVLAISLDQFKQWCSTGSFAPTVV